MKMHWMLNRGTIAIVLMVITFTSAKSFKDSNSQIRVKTNGKITKSQPLVPIKSNTKNFLRRLDFGQNSHLRPNVPSEVQISSQPIKINKPANASGGRVKHRKRQILIQDATQYLASQGIVFPQQQQQQGSLTAGNSQVSSPAVNPYQNFYYSQPQQIQDFSGAIMATPIPAISQYQYPQAATATMSSLQGGAPQSQIYVLQPDGNTYAPLNTMSLASQQQIQHRVGEPLTITPIEQPKEPIPPVPQEPVRPKVTVVHHASAQKQEHKSPEVVPESKFVPEVKSAQVGSEQQSTILLPQGASTIIHTNQPLEQQQQIVQVPAQSQQHTLQTLLQPAPGQAYFLHHPQAVLPSPDVLEERQSFVQPGPAHPSNFVIKPQTYLNPAGGQMFTVPVPIPQEQHHNFQQQNQVNQMDEEPQNDESHEHQDRADREHHEHESEHHHKEFRPVHAIMNRVLDAFSVNRRTKERVEQNIYLPVLASTGVFLGLGALAAGWYLSQANREVGLLRRTGKPYAGGPNVQRVRRNAPSPGPAELDQASFFQTIIQHAIEKQQKEFEDEPEGASSEQVTKYVKKDQVDVHPHSYGHHDEHHQHDDHHTKTKVVKYHHHHYKPAPHKKAHHHHHHKPTKSHGLWSRQAINFANVFVPAVTVGGSVLIIGALIVFWYLSGSNREIAFLEPSAYSRRKRSLDAASSTTFLSDGWIQRILSAIHDDPYQNEQAGASNADAAASNNIDMMLSPGGAFDSSKHNNKQADLSNAVVAVSLAIVAFFAMMALVLGWFLAENDRGGGFANGALTGTQWAPHYRKARSVSPTNELNAGLSSDPSFLDKILSNLEVSQNSILSKLQEVGYSKWQETPCAKRIFCDVMSAQNDDTIRVMEKRMATFISMLPASLSSSLSKSLGDVMYSIQRKDCSSYTCGGHWVDSSIINQPSPPEPSRHYQPR